MYIIFSIIGILCLAVGVGLMVYDLILDIKQEEWRDVMKACALLRLTLVLICFGNVLISFARLIQ